MTGVKQIFFKPYKIDKYKIVVLMSFIIVKIDAARILAVFPTPSISHQIVFRPLTQELVKRGHEVVVITTDPAFPSGEAPVNLTEIDVHNISYQIWLNEFLSPAVGKHGDRYKQIKRYSEVTTLILENQLQTEAVQNILKNHNNETFDLLILETCVRPVLAFSYAYKAPVIAISSLGPNLKMNGMIGVPTHPLLYPMLINQRIYNLTYWEKLTEIFYHYLIDYFLNSFEQEQNEMLKKYFGPDIPTLSELYKNIDMYFQNVYPVFMDNTPVPPSVIHMGGLHQKPPEALPQDLRSYLDKSESGVIYVSFGTNVKLSLLLPEKVQMMIKVFTELPYDVLWKMDNNTSLSEISKKIKVSDWFPQPDLLKLLLLLYEGKHPGKNVELLIHERETYRFTLGHKNIKMFITQGGLQSTDEAITAGVPLIGIPMYADQWFNTEKYVRHKIGLKLKLVSLTEEEFRSAILTVAEDISYRENIINLRKIINDQPQKPLERAIWWIEYVLRHGGAKHLRAPAANMSWAEYYELNLILIILFSLILSFFSLYLVLVFIWSNILRVFKSDKVQTS